MRERRSTLPVSMSSVAKELPKPKLPWTTAESMAELGLKVLVAWGLASGLESPVPEAHLGHRKKLGPL